MKAQFAKPNKAHCSDFQFEEKALTLKCRGFIMDTFYNEIQMREGIKVGGAMRDMQQPLNLATAAVLSS